MEAEQWYVFYTTPRAEKAVNIRLKKSGFITYLPVYTSKRIWKDRKKNIEVPLFSSYIFVKTTPKYLVKIGQLQGIVKVVIDQGHPAYITQDAIEDIKLFLEDTEGYRIAMTEGDDVIIEKGLLAGKQGKVLRVNKEKVVLYIKQLGLGAVAEIDRADIA